MTGHERGDRSSLTPGLDPVVDQKKAVTLPDRSTADQKLQPSTTPVRCIRLQAMRIGMDGTRLASEYEADAHLASSESAQGESSCFDSYDGCDVSGRERTSKRGSDSSKKLGITQRVGEVGMALGPPERAEQKLLGPEAFVHRAIVTDAVIASSRCCERGAGTR